MNKTGLVSFFARSITIPVSATSVYKLPLGNYTLATPDNLTVYVDGLEMQYGIDFVPYYPGLLNPQDSAKARPSIRNTAIGAYFPGGPPTGAEVDIRWREAVLALPPPVPYLARVDKDGAVITAQSGWPSSLDPGNAPGTPGAPNAFAVPEAQDGLIAEVWRFTPHISGVYAAGQSGGQPAERHRYRQHRLYDRWDGTTPPGVIIPSRFGAPGRKRLAYRVSYYDPETGARTGLSVQQVLFKGTRSESNSAQSPQHFQGSCWINQA